MKKVKILGFVGEYTPNQIVEVEDAMATQLCAKSYRGDVRAMLLEDAIKLEQNPTPVEELTACDMASAGRRNVVETPSEHREYFEKRKMAEILDEPMVEEKPVKAKRK